MDTQATSNNVQEPLFFLPVLPQFQQPNILLKEQNVKQEPKIKTAIKTIQNPDVVKTESKSLSLLEHQGAHFTRVSEILAQHFAYLDTSETGCGKTFIAMKLAEIYKYKLFVIAPKGVCSTWKNECAQHGIDLIEAMSYEKLRGFERQTNPNTYVIRNGSRFTATNYFKTLVNGKILLIFDEVHRLKNRKTASLAAAHSLVKEIVKLNCGSRIAGLSASPFDKPEHAFSIMKALGVVLSDELYDYDRSEKVYNLIGMKEIMSYSRRIDSNLADRLSGFMVNRGGINKASFKYFQKIIKVGLSSSMPRPKIKSNFDAKNGYYIMPPEDDKIIVKGAENLARAVRFDPTTGRITRETPDFGAITAALMMLERGKINTLFRLGFETLIRVPNSKIIIYVWYKNTMQQLLKLFKDELVDANVMNGDTKQSERDKITKTFQQANLNSRVLITSCPVGGVGLTLDDQIGKYPRFTFCNPNYRFIDLYQAGGRTYRVKTKSNATVRFVYSKNAQVETRIYDALVRKGNTTRSVLHKGDDVVLPGDLPRYEETTVETK